MTQLTPHIRVLRELASQFHTHSEEVVDRGREERIPAIREKMADLGALLQSMAFVHERAALQLEAEEQSLQPNMDSTVTYNPKGKKTE